MGFLSKLTVYAQSWKEESREKLPASDIKAIDKAEVVNSEFGLSACFFLKSGGRSYIPLSRDVEAEVGDVIPLNKAQVITLSREGDDDIFRLTY